ncbi:MAG: SusE domain-containing protein [Chitinophagaceae bacterium]|nr:SusE domain-containing protein [Chitinophagaceae bacterium]
MKLNKLWLMAVAVLGFTACEKVADLPLYNNGVAPVLSASTTAVAPPASDSLKPVITFSWTDPAYATDTARVKYTIEIDSAGRNFSKAVSKVLIGTKSTTFLAKDFNNILLGFGFNFGTAYDVDVRLTSSYNNNNERMVGNTIKLKATPYKVPPKVPLPTTGRLFITGNATDFDWTNPDPMPAVRELTRIEETKWAGIFHLSGGGNFLILRQAGNWDDKYAVADKNAVGLANGGGFGFKLGDDFPANVKDGEGWYRLELDFQTGNFKQTKVANPLPETLFTTGDATNSSWTNSPPSDQEFTGVTNGVFDITTSLKAGGYLKFLSNNGNWAPQFGGNSATGGTLGANYGSGGDPDAIPIATTGSYKINVNFITGKYTVTKL